MQPQNSTGIDSQSRRVAITGVGVLNALGLTQETLWQGLREGKSGIHLIQSIDTTPLRTRFAGEIVGFDAKKYVEKKERKNLRVWARSIQLAVSGAQLAMEDARIDKARLDPARFGVEFGAGLMPSELDELAPAAQVSTNGSPDHVDMEKWGEKGIPNIQPLWMLKYLPNLLACHISILHNAQGPNNSVTESEVAGLLALGEASRILRRNDADFFLVGGADSKIHPLSLVRQDLFGHLSKRNDAPEKACRPFDRERDGGVLGEGCAVLAVEDLQHALARGARIYAEVIGFGAAFDRGKTGQGIARAIQTALHEAGIGPEDLDHVNAHGVSTVPIDAWEARGIRAALGDVPVTVFAPSSYFGNVGAGSATSELAASVLALHHGLLPGTLNYQTPDPECPVAVTPEPRPVQKPYFLKVSFTEMGQCGAVVCKKWE